MLVLLSILFINGTVFREIGTYKWGMTAKDESKHPSPILAMAGGPWGGGEDDNAQNRPAGDKPSSPWLPSGGSDGNRGGGSGGGQGGGKGPGGLDDMFRRGPFGPNGPRFPANSGVIWKLAIGAFVLIWLGSTTLHIVDPEEDAVVTQLGQYNRTVGPGVQLTLPAPFEAIQKVPARRIQTEDIPGSGSTGQNLVLTRDANIIALSYSVRWSIKTPSLYVFAVSEPSRTIRAAAESAMRSTIANFTLAQAIGSGQTEISEQVKDHLQAILDSYRSGIRIEGVAIRESAPPQQVEEAFNQVNAARQESEAKINLARGYAAEVISRAQGEAGEFDRIYAQYRLAPEVTRRRMYLETMEQVLAPAPKTIIDANGAVPYLPLPQRAAPEQEGARTVPEPTTTTTTQGGR